MSSERLRHLVFCEDPAVCVGVFPTYKDAYAAWCACSDGVPFKFFIAPLPRAIDPKQEIIDVNE